MKTELVANPIMMQLAQGMVKPSFNVMLGVELFCNGIPFLENFTLCDVNNFDVILRNTFLDTYKVYIFHNEGRLKVLAKNGFKLVNLYADYDFALLEMGVNLVTLINELKLPNFLLLVFLKISQRKLKP